ncbi:endonuclease domain-containing protein [Agromyces salentinus]|uniref:DUF559 domain-containing protein n=1 Tax=Agromyces salentinus TaxID=269421 RepID=A0ABN2MSE5_9MICO|nr:DUF559 domain-containing protein [Agromyces salentinus]
MPRRVTVPPHLRGAAFRAADAEFHGLGQKRLRAADVDRPFTGVRSIGLDPTSIVDLCRAYEPLLRPGESFSHATAARLYGLPLPPGIALAPLHVLAPPGIARARTAGSAGHEASAPPRIEFLFGLPVVTAVSAWCQLSTVLAVEDLIAVGDALVTGRRDGRRRRPAAASVDDLDAAVRAWPPRRGARRLQLALPLIRVGPESRPETRTRLALMGGGLPEPTIAPDVCVEGGREILHPDLAYLDWRIAIEYEGDHHRDPARWKRDITRREKFEAAGWRVIRVTSDDVFGDPAALVARVRRVIALQTASG